MTPPSRVEKILAACNRVVHATSEAQSAADSDNQSRQYPWYDINEICATEQGRLAQSEHHDAEEQFMQTMMEKQFENGVMIRR